MDEARIQQLTRDVLSKLQDSGDPDVSERVAALEARVANLEAAGRQAAPALIRVASAVVATPASLQVLGIAGGSDHCVMEPDKPCIQSHACRTFGH